MAKHTAESRPIQNLGPWKKRDQVQQLIDDIGGEEALRELAVAFKGVPAQQLPAAVARHRIKCHVFGPHKVRSQATALRKARVDLP